MLEKIELQKNNAFLTFSIFLMFDPTKKSTESKIQNFDFLRFFVCLFCTSSPIFMMIGPKP